MDQDIIPIDDAISDFKFHLENHARTILSSGFGEGKTYFLNECKSSLDNFVFITLYPINYQVISNEDIFDVIKRDILFQLFLNNILKPTQRISTKVALSFFLLNPCNYLEWIISSVSSLDYPELAAIKAISQATKFFKKAHNVFTEYCNKHNILENECIKLWDKVEKKGIYECDIVTKLISESIANWKKANPNKRIVLLVEDLDRIDPAHLFRILNVLSAHIDYAYKFGISVSTENIDGNKFGFDNIVCVLDYDNLISIFRHFYGDGTSFEGYISKFLSKGYFKYSLSEQKVKYFFKKASAICELDESYVKMLIKEDVIKNTSMRVLNAALDDIPSQYHPIPDYFKNNIRKVYPVNLLKFFVLMRRMNISDNQIIQAVLACIRSNKEIKYLVIPYYFLMYDAELSTISYGEKEGGYLVRYEVLQNNKPNFEMRVSRLSGYSNDTTYPSFDKTLRYMLSKVGK